MRSAPLLLALLVVGAVACSDDGGDDGGDDGATGGDAATTTTGAPAAAGEGTIVVRLEETDGIFIEGFEVGLRFTDAATGDELDRIAWSEDATLPPGTGAEGLYDATYELVVPAGTVRVGADVNIGIGPGPEPPDLDANPMPCELDVGVPADGLVNVFVAFDDAADDCLQVVEGLID